MFFPPVHIALSMVIKAHEKNEKKNTSSDNLHTIM